MDSLHRIIKKLSNKIIDLNKGLGEGRNPFNPFVKKKKKNPCIPPLLGINLEEFSMENYC